MKVKILIILIITIGIGIGFYLWEESKIFKEITPTDRELENLGSIIFRNTEFKDLKVDILNFKYPADWSKVEVEPSLIWPEEFAEREELLLYLVNPDEVKMIVTKRKIEPEDLTRPYPLVLREVFAKEREIMEREGGLENFQLISEDFFEDGVILESKASIFGKLTFSISKSIFWKRGNEGFIYSVGISGPDWIFKDYQPLVKYIVNSVRCY